MSLIQLKQLKKRILALSLLLMVVAGQSAYAVSQSSHTALKQYEASSGGKGQDVIALKKQEVAATSCAVFADASVEYKKRRFGGAKIDKKPAKGCNPAKQACKVTVDWHHAPAGRLHYRVKVKWDVKSSGC